MRRILILVSLVWHLGACGEIQSSLGDVKDPSSVFPEDIIYKPIGACDDGTLSFVVMGAGGIMLWTDPASVLTGQIELYIHPDRTFDARYREYDFVSKRYDQLIHSQISIDWEKSVIRFEGLGDGQVARFNGQTYLDLTFTHAFNSSLLVGKSSRFRIYKSDRGFETDRADYCGF